MTPSAGELLIAARSRYDDPASSLARSAVALAPRGFAGGGEWMRCALGNLRGVAPTNDHPFHRLGLRKYTLALMPALGVGVSLALVSWWLVPIAVVVFYLIESRMVFAFPCALDGSCRPLRDSHRLVGRAVVAPLATLAVMRFAAEMLVGGFLGRGFVRSWCVGCLAVVIWYEAARRENGGAAIA